VREIRVYVDASLAEGRELELDERATHRVVRVLRRRTGDALVVFDGRGREAVAEIIRAHRRDGCRIRLGPARDADRESPLAIELVQGMARGDKLDLVVQKATELGAVAIRPVLTGRSEVRPRDAAGRVVRWREIAISACEQCGRNVLPAIHAPVPLAEFECTAVRRLMLLPGTARSIGDLEESAGPVSVAVGPEGGMDADDAAQLAGMGFEAVGMGPRVLRTETAAIAALAALQARFGDL